MPTQQPQNTGSWIALLIGLPFGVVFSYAILYISLFPMIDMFLAIIGGVVFWYPVVWAGIIPVVFMLVLWLAGRKIHRRLDNNYSTLWTSFRFTLFVNTWMFGLLMVFFVIGNVFFSVISNTKFGIGIGVAITLFMFGIATVFTTFTIGLLIVVVTKNRIRSR